jgi:hypothetical protein
LFFSLLLQVQGPRGTLNIITALVFDDGKFRDTLHVEVHPPDTVMELHDRICDKLRSCRLLGNEFDSDLKTITFQEGQSLNSLYTTHNLASLQEKDFLPVTGLPCTLALSYFSSLHNPRELLHPQAPGDEEEISGYATPTGRLVFSSLSQQIDR